MFDFLAAPLYIRLSPYKLSVRNVKTGLSINEVPEIALSRGLNSHVRWYLTSARANGY